MLRGGAGVTAGGGVPAEPGTPGEPGSGGGAALRDDVIAAFGSHALSNVSFSPRTTVSALRDWTSPPGVSQVKTQDSVPPAAPIHGRVDGPTCHSKRPFDGTFVSVSMKSSNEVAGSRSSSSQDPL